MRWTMLSSLGVATIVFYLPAFVASAALLFLHGSPRMVWFLLLLMSAIRIAGGVLLILYESGGHYHNDLSTSMSIILGVGIFPLVFAVVGWLYTFDKINSQQEKKRLRLSLIGTGIAGVTALACIMAGSILHCRLDYEASGLRASAAFVKTGAVLVIATLATCIGLVITLWVELIRRKVRSNLLYLILSMLSLSVVLLILRTVYLCLVIFYGGPNSIWSPLHPGSLDTLIRMSLLPEYVVVAVMVATGFWMLRCVGVQKPDAECTEI